MLSSETRQTLERLIASVADHASARMYREQWGDNRSFETLPTVSRDDFLRTPLSERRYKEEQSLVKIIHTPTGPFLSEWSFDDIAREPFGSIGTRPMVYLSDSHDAIEKSMWCYEHNRVPLIGEKDPDIAMFTAARYQIDSLIVDAVSLELLAPYLQKRDTPLESMIIIGESFDGAALIPYAAYAKQVRLVLARAETGVFAGAMLDEYPVYTALPGCVLEYDDVLIVTKIDLFITPIIRYRTELKGSLDATREPSRFTVV